MTKRQFYAKCSGTGMNPSAIMFLIPGLYARIRAIESSEELPKDIAEECLEALRMVLGNKAFRMYEGKKIYLGDWVRGIDKDGERVCGKVISLYPFRCHIYGERNERIWNVSL